MDSYADILHCSRYELQHHATMSMHSRAAQFSPFAALTGYDEAIDETARRTECRAELAEDALAELDHAFCQLLEIQHTRPLVSLVYFQLDGRKEGGAYLQYQGNLRFVDEVLGKFQFTDGTSIPISDVYQIQILTEDEKNRH